MSQGSAGTPSRAWLAAPAVGFALVSLTVGLVAKQTIRSPYSTPFFHLFFSDTLHMKVWLLTIALVLALGQLLSASRIYQLLASLHPAVSTTSCIAGRAGRRSCSPSRSRTTASSCWASGRTTRGSISTRCLDRSFTG